MIARITHRRAHWSILHTPAYPNVKSQRLQRSRRQAGDRDGIVRRRWMSCVKPVVTATRRRDHSRTRRSMQGNPMARKRQRCVCTYHAGGGSIFPSRQPFLWPKRKDASVTVGQRGASHEHRRPFSKRCFAIAIAPISQSITPSLPIANPR